jgi:hypothetical protein
MTVASLPIFGARSEPRQAQSSSSFWTVQIACWSAYGTALMVPWLGVYPIRIMLPNKVAIAGTGLLISVALRTIYRLGVKHDVKTRGILSIIGVACGLGGVIWSGVGAVVMGTSFVDQLTRFSTVHAGIPELGGAVYHTLVLLLWSASYIALAGMRSAESSAVSLRPAEIPGSDPGGAAVAADELRERRVIARDGNRALVLDVDDIRWIQAEGDYVRVHTSARSLLLRDTMTRLESALTHDFVRIHRSAIVNASVVRVVIARPNRDSQVVLRDGTRLKASRTYAERLRQVLGLERRSTLPATGGGSGPHDIGR